MWNVIGISFLAGMSTPLGGWFVLQFRHLSMRMMTTLLGMAAGIMVTVILTELMPTSLTAGSHELFLLGFTSGWLLMWGLKKSLGQLHKAEKLTNDKGAYLRMGWFIAIAIAIHDLPEGLAIGAGDAVEHHVGLFIALAIALHNIPEGMSIAAPLRLGGMAKAQVFWITLLTGLITPLGTIIAVWLFTISHAFIALSLAFASGAMAFVVAQDIFPEAWRLDKLTTLAGVCLGSALMIAMTLLHF